MLKQIIRTIFSSVGYELKRKHRTGMRICWPSQFNNPQTVFETDESFHDLYEEAQKKTQMANSDNPLRRQRHYVLNGLLKQMNVEQGDVCELGCRRGLSAYQIAHYMKKADSQKTFHIFDSFEGLSELSVYDKLNGSDQNETEIREKFACPYEITNQNLNEFNFIRFYKGWIPDRFNEVEDRSFSFVHIDVDLYQPILDSIEFFFPRLINKGIMVFDDYGCSAFPGAKKAVDEYLRTLSNSFFLSLPSGEAFLIKGI